MNQSMAHTCTCVDCGRTLPTALTASEHDYKCIRCGVEYTPLTSNEDCPACGNNGTSVEHHTKIAQ